MGLSVNQLINCADDNPIRFSPRRFDLYAVERLPQCVRAARVLVYRQGFLYLRVDQFGKKGYVGKCVMVYSAPAFVLYLERKCNSSLLFTTCSCSCQVHRLLNYCVRYWNSVGAVPPYTESAITYLS